MKDKDVNPQELSYHHSKIPKDLAEKRNYLNALEKSFYEELKTNPDYLPFFKNYRAETIDDFCMSYASHKRRLIEYYETCKNLAETPLELNYRSQAEEVFEMILQKKLFNLQLLWRAEEITHPELKLSIDFLFWEDNIKYASFLDEVTQEEVNALKDFLSYNYFHDHVEGSNGLWQKYDQFMGEKEDDEREDMPEWYKVYDNRFGTFTLLLKPDVRGAKEDKYRHLYSQWKRTQPLPVIKNPYVAPPPYLFANLETLSIFINMFEHDYLQQAQKNHVKVEGDPFDRTYEDEQLQWAINVLKEAKPDIKLKEDLVWNEAIIEGARRYENEMVIKELQTVYEDYLMQREMKIGVQSRDKKKEYDDYFLRPIVTEQILKGRSLAGELEDLDF